MIIARLIDFSLLLVGSMLVLTTDTYAYLYRHMNIRLFAGGVLWTHNVISVSWSYLFVAERGSMVDRELLLRVTAELCAYQFFVCCSFGMNPSLARVRLYLPHVLHVTWTRLPFFPLFPRIRTVALVPGVSSELHSLQTALFNSGSLCTGKGGTGRSEEGV